MIGVKIIVDDEETSTHVTGHPCRAELRRLIALIRPKARRRPWMRRSRAAQILIPVHGEFRHLEEHAKLARSCEVRPCNHHTAGHAAGAPHGHPVQRHCVPPRPRSAPRRADASHSLTSGPFAAVGRVPSGHLCVDGTLLRPISSAAVKKREVGVLLFVCGSLTLGRCC